MKFWHSVALGVLISGSLIGVSCGDRPVKSPPADPPDEVSDLPKPTDSGEVIAVSSTEISSQMERLCS